MGSFTTMIEPPSVLSRLPTGLADTGDLALVGQLSKADTANAVLAKHRMGAAAQPTPGVSAGRELRL